MVTMGFFRRICLHSATLAYKTDFVGLTQDKGIRIKTQNVLLTILNRLYKSDDLNCTIK